MILTEWMGQWMGRPRQNSRLRGDDLRAVVRQTTGQTFHLTGGMGQCQSGRAEVGDHVIDDSGCVPLPSEPCSSASGIVRGSPGDAISAFHRAHPRARAIFRADAWPRDGRCAAPPRGYKWACPGPGAGAYHLCRWPSGSRSRSPTGPRPRAPGGRPTATQLSRRRTPRVCLTGCGTSSVGVVLEVELPDEFAWDILLTAPAVRAALDAMPDPVGGLLVHRGRGGSAGVRWPRRPRPLAGAGAVALPEPVEQERSVFAPQTLVAP